MTRRWVKEKYYEWGPGHALWESRVLGNFPKQSQDAVFSLAWLEAAQRREPKYDPRFAITAGIDVAGPGEDETVLVLRQGGNLLSVEAFPQQDARGALVAALLPYQGRLDCVNVDCAGLGWYMSQHLNEFFNVHAINVGIASSDPARFVNLKSELYWGLRMYFQQNAISGLKDDKMIAQLAAMRYRHNARGQVVMESKEEARKRGVRSPDRGEALMLSFMPQPIEEVATYAGDGVHVSPF
jgi:hypothetical protein